MIVNASAFIMLHWVFVGSHINDNINNTIVDVFFVIKESITKVQRGQA